MTSESLEKYKAPYLGYSPADYVFPVALGHEAETAHLIDRGDGTKPSETHDLAMNGHLYLPQYMQGNDGFTKNGFKVHPGGESICEIAGPECSTPVEVALYRRVGTRMFHIILENFLIEQSAATPENTMAARSHERVVDAYGSRKGSHLSAGIYAPSKYKIDFATILSHQAARSFITGAGYARRGGLRFAQKVGGLEDETGYGFRGTMTRQSLFREGKNDDTVRYEDRCGDINISDWATWQHAGGLALAIAISRTPLRHKLPELNAGQPIIAAKRLNVALLGEEGELAPIREIGFAAVDFEQKLAELVLGEMVHYVDEVPIHYVRVAEERYKYCEEFRSVLLGNDTIFTLANRADWAAKFALSLQKMERQRANYGAEREVADWQFEIDDMQYDKTIIEAKNGAITKRDSGYGYKLRAKTPVLRMFSDIEVERAFTKPPSTTRAQVRGELLTTYSAIGASWTYVNIVDPETGKTHRVDLNSVTRSDLTRLAKEKLSNIKERP